jgi:hypothetical protein
MARGPLRPHKGGSLQSLYGEHLDQQLKALCGRLGVDYSDNETAATDMWAEIGERLALQQPEFMPPRTRGRPKVLLTREMQLAERSSLFSVMILLCRIKRGEEALCGQTLFGKVRSASAISRQNAALPDS